MADIGDLYMQTSESQNRLVHYVRGEDGTLTEVERCPRGGAGTGAFNCRANPAGIIIDGRKACSSRLTTVASS
jgi:hypothetical protein